MIWYRSICGCNKPYTHTHTRSRSLTHYGLRSMQFIHSCYVRVHGFVTFTTMTRSLAFYFDSLWLVVSHPLLIFIHQKKNRVCHFGCKFGPRHIHKHKYKQKNLWNEYEWRVMNIKAIGYDYYLHFSFVLNVFLLSVQHMYQSHMLLFAHASYNVHACVSACHLQCDIDV